MSSVSFRGEVSEEGRGYYLFSVLTAYLKLITISIVCATFNFIGLFGILLDY